MKKIVPLIACLLLPAFASAAEYKIDPTHSTVGFKIKHLAISTVAGSFTDFTGSFEFEPNKIEASKAEAQINIKSVDTNQGKRDDHLRSPDFFDVAKFPEMKFVSKKVSDVKGDTFKVDGDLTIHGVTKPVTLDVTFGGVAKDPWNNERAAFAATTKINRKDFGLTWNKALETGGLVVGEEVAVNIEIEGIKETKTASAS